MRPESERERVKELIVDGLNDCEISRTTGIPRCTVRDWRHGRITKARRAGAGSCAACGGDHDFVELPGPQYSYLLGMYLGDGFIAKGKRGVYQLRVYLDSRYPLLNQEVADAMEAVIPGKTAHHTLHRTAAMVTVDMWSKQWPCMFPQHGPGMKHQRPISLHDWQQAIVDGHHEEFLRGLVHSDGCRFINRVWVQGKSYEYPRYNFTNASADIRALFCASCDALGIAWRQMNARNISVARRQAVARMDEFIGPKR